MTIRDLMRSMGLAVGATLLVLGASAAERSGAPQERARIRVLSSRPDMVSEGSALIAVSVSAGVRISNVRVTVDDTDVTSDLKRRGDSLEGLVSGLHLGTNEMTATVEGRAITLKLVDHSRNGPIISGPHQEPFICRTNDLRLPDGSTLGPAQDSDCNAPTKVIYVYKPADGGAFKVLPSTHSLPPDVSKTTTTDGKIVNYIVRVETGTINRAIYQFAVLDDPTRDPPPSPLATSYNGWNRKLIFVFGGSASAGYQQGRTIGDMSIAVPTGIINTDAYMLAKGFAVATSTLDVFGNAENSVLAAETASMVKEKFIKTFGAPIYTMGWGGSGGSMLQQLIANDYPGILDGITPAASFPDLISVVEPADDCSLLGRAFDAMSHPWTEAQKTAVSGYGSWSAVCGPGKSPFTWQLYSPWWMRATRSHTPLTPIPGGGDLDTNNCSHVLPQLLIYNPISDRHGARCDVFSGIINEVGVDPATGYAARGFDNVGVEYGLRAYRSGTISAEQFVELNERVGGYDGDGNYQSARTTANLMALKNLYRYGQVNEGQNLRNVPIIDFRFNPGVKGNVHSSVWSYVMRARLVRANGEAGNQVMIRYDAAALRAGASAESSADKMNVYVMLQMDRWLSKMKAETRRYPSMAAKVVADKPTGLITACFPSPGERIKMSPELDRGGRCGKLMPVFANPRMVAGEPLAMDVLKCQLKPLRRSVYPRLSDAQFARLTAVFPEGVCDYSKAGVGSEPLKSPWLAYPRPGVGVPLHALH